MIKCNSLQPCYSAPTTAKQWLSPCASLLPNACCLVWGRSRSVDLISPGSSFRHVSCALNDLQAAAVHVGLAMVLVGELLRKTAMVRRTFRTSALATTLTHNNPPSGRHRSSPPSQTSPTTSDSTNTTPTTSSPRGSTGAAARRLLQRVMPPLLTSPCACGRHIRHPGYLGWFIWALGTQVLLCNPISCTAFALTVRPNPPPSPPLLPKPHAVSSQALPCSIQHAASSQRALSMKSVPNLWLVSLRNTGRLGAACS
jgi:hypothetical protein